MSEAEGLANFGLFLTLAFVLPGVVYVGLIEFFFPAALEVFGLNIQTWDGLLGSSIIVGLLLTSICFVIELQVIKRFYKIKCSQLKKKEWKQPDVYKIGSFQAKGKSTLYLNQVVGQYILHINLGIGCLLLLIAYPLYLYHYGILTTFSVGKVILGLAISVTNLYLGMVTFRDWSVQALESYASAT